MFSDILQDLTFSHLCLILATVLALYYLSWTIYACYFHPYADIPGPTLAKISRLWIGASVGQGNVEHTQRALHRKHGPLFRIAHDEVSVSDPAAVEIIYNVKSGFTKTDFYPPFAPKISPHGDHFTQLDEKKHPERRKFLNHIYSMSNACGDVFLAKMEPPCRVEWNQHSAECSTLLAAASRVSIWRPSRFFH